VYRNDKLSSEQYFIATGFCDEILNLMKRGQHFYSDFPFDEFFGSTQLTLWENDILRFSYGFINTKGISIKTGDRLKLSRHYTLISEYEILVNMDEPQIGLVIYSKENLFDFREDFAKLKITLLKSPTEAELSAITFGLL